MKQNLLLMVCVVATVTHAAEPETSVSFMVNRTEFRVTKGSIHEHHAHVDLIVLGRNQQRKLKAPALDDNCITGMMFLDQSKTMMVLPQEADSASDDDTYKFYGLGLESFKYEKAYKKDLSCPVLLIIEPRIIATTVYDEKDNKQVEGPGYFPEKRHPTQKDTFLTPQFRGATALSEASRDLEICYHKALREGLNILKDKRDKKIAIDALGTSAGFPRKTAVPVTFAAIIEFINKNSGYVLVELFVKKRSELRWYKPLFASYR